MFIVVLRVTQIAKIMIATGSINNSVQPNPFNPIVAISPTRALCAVDIIISNTGIAATNPIDAANVLIFATINCICRATKPSDAPI